MKNIFSKLIAAGSAVAGLALASTCFAVDWDPSELINGVHTNVSSTMTDVTPTLVYILLIGLGFSAAFFGYGLIKGLLKHKKQA